MSPLDLRYVRPVHPLRFDASDPEWDMGQSDRHVAFCFLLRELLLRAVGEGSTVGIDQFVFWDARNAKKKCAPDAFIKLGVKHDPDRDSWRTWEAGAPELCIEVLSRSDHEKLTLDEKLARFHALGTSEVVVFDVDAPEGSRLRVWDRVDGDLIERVVEGERTPCRTLGLYFVLAPFEQRPVALRLARDADGRDLLPSAREGERIAAQRSQAAERRVAELEATVSELTREKDG